MVATGQRIAELAERHKVTVLLEPFYRGFLASAKRTRLFLEAVNSPRVRALLDPANLLEVNDLEEMFQQLKPWIGCLHAKDRKLHVDHGVAAGKATWIMGRSSAWPPNTHPRPRSSWSTSVPAISRTLCSISAK